MSSSHAFAFAPSASSRAHNDLYCGRNRKPRRRKTPATPHHTINIPAHLFLLVANCRSATAKMSNAVNLADFQFELATELNNDHSLGIVKIYLERPCFREYLANIELEKNGNLEALLKKLQLNWDKAVDVINTRAANFVNGEADADTRLCDSPEDATIDKLAMTVQ